MRKPDLNSTLLILAVAAIILFVLVKVPLLAWLS